MTITTAASEVKQNVVRLNWQGVPRVNLLPPEIIEARSFRRVQQRLAAAAGVALLACVGATLWASSQVSDAQAEYTLVEAHHAELLAQAATYAEVPRVLGQVDRARLAREQAMARDVLWFRFLDELAVATPATVGLTSLEVTMVDGPAVSAPDALTQAGLGTVLVAGTTTKMPEVAQWLTSVARVHGMDVSRLQSAVREDQAVTGAVKVNFTAAVGITENAKSHRYDRKDG